MEVMEVFIMTSLLPNLNDSNGSNDVVMIVSFPKLKEVMEVISSNQDILNKRQSRNAL